MASLFKNTTTYDPIKGLLNAEDEKLRDELTQKWKDNKLEELNFVGIVGALLAGVLTSTGSWPSILSNGTEQPWTVRACWYGGIILALASVLTAAQQSIRLHRLSSHERANTSLRRLLSTGKRGHDGYLKPRTAQVYAWQLSVFFLTLSVLAMLAGMFILIWSSTGNQPFGESWWNGNAKLAVTFSIVGGVIATLFLFEQITLYSWHGKDDSDGSRG